MINFNAACSFCSLVVNSQMYSLSIQVIHWYFLLWSTSLIALLIRTHVSLHHQNILNHFVTWIMFSCTPSNVVKGRLDFILFCSQAVTMPGTCQVFGVNVACFWWRVPHTSVSVVFTDLHTCWAYKRDLKTLKTDVA